MAKQIFNPEPPESTNICEIFGKNHFHRGLFNKLNKTKLIDDNHKYSTTSL